MASSDQLAFDIASVSSDAPSIFTRKDWLSILDNQGGNYQGNQCVIDTSQLANSNKYMNYREAYLSVPLIMTLTTPVAVLAVQNTCDFALGLKNNFATIIHSTTIEFNGTTIKQQVPYESLWNSFKLMTSLSYNDLLTQGPSIGFYPDTSTSWSYNATANDNGNAPHSQTSNNNNYPANINAVAVQNGMDVLNNGFYQRQKYWNFSTLSSNGFAAVIAGSTNGNLLPANSLTQLQKSYIYNKTNGTIALPGVWQAQIMATIKLRHLCDFFDKLPLLKGVFMKLTLTLNQPTVQVTAAGNVFATNDVIVNVPSGGINPLMFASCIAYNGGAGIGGANAVVASLNVGNKVISSLQTNVVGIANSSLPQSVMLTVPSYTFNPIFESSYLSSPIKRVVYEDVYQYYVPTVAPGATFNQLVTNGIANIKSVLVLPFFATGGAAAGANIMNPLQSPFDPCGGGPTSPLALLSNYNVMISGQNMLYTTYSYSYQEYLNQLYGERSVNHGMEDGLGSGLVSQLDFENTYSYYYVNCSRALPVEQQIAKSVSIIGQNMSTMPITLYVFVSFSKELSVDLLTGSRV